MYMCCQNASSLCSLMPPSRTSAASCCALLGARKVLVHCQSASRPLGRNSLLHYQALPRCSGTVTGQKGAAAGMQKQAVTLSAVSAVPVCVQLALEAQIIALHPGAGRLQAVCALSVRVQAPKTQVPAARLGIALLLWNSETLNRCSCSPEEAEGDKLSGVCGSRPRPGTRGRIPAALLSAGVDCKQSAQMLAMSRHHTRRLLLHD